MVARESLPCSAVACRQTQFLHKFQGAADSWPNLSQAQVPIDDQLTTEQELSVWHTEASSIGLVEEEKWLSFT